MSTQAAAKKPDPSLVLANGLVLAEFDIDKGACVRTYYPKASAPNVGGARRKPMGVNVAAEAEYFANHMLPDGAERLTVARTIFVVNRPRPRVCSRFPVYAFDHGDDGVWRRREVHGGSIVSDILMLDMRTATLTVRFDEAVLVDAFPTSEGSVVATPAPPLEVAEVARAVRAVQGQAMAPVGALLPGSAAEGGAAGAGAGAGGASSLAPTEFTFLVAQSEGRPPMGLLMPTAQHTRFLAELRKAQRPPSPLPVLPSPTGEETAGAGEVDAAAASGGSAPVAAGEGENGHCVDDAAGPGAATPEAGGGAGGGTAEESGGEGHSPGIPEVPTAHVTTTAAATGPLTDTGAGEGVGEAGRPARAGAAAPLTAAAVAEYRDPTVAAFGDRPPLTLPSVIMAASTSAGSYPGNSSVSSPTSRLGLGEESTGEILYGLCAVVSKRDTSARRGGRTKAVAILGPSLAWLEPFFPILVEAAQYCCDIPGSDADAVQQQSKVLKLCYETVNAATQAVSAGMAKTSRLLTEVARYSTFGGSKEAYATFHTAPFGTTHRTRIPLAPSSHDITFTRYSLENLIEAMGPSFMHLVRGIMTEKKIIVLSRMGLSTDVAEAAMALGTLGNLLDPNFIATKVFPYTSVNSVEHFLSVPGYIIGTLNPIFDSERTWHWDMLCDLDKKTVVLGEAESSAYGGAGGARKHGIVNTVGGVVSSLSLGAGVHAGGGGDVEAAPETAQFFKDLTSSIYRMRALRIPVSERYRRLRLVFEEFMQTAVMVTYVQDHPNIQAPVAALKEHFMNPVLNALRAQCRLTSLMDDVRTNILFPGESPALLLCTAALRRVKGVETAGVLSLLHAISAMMDSDEQVLLLLRRMTVAAGGLNPIGMQLTHPSQAVRIAAVRILARIDKLPEGKAAVAAMNGFLILAYEDISKRVLT